jgi:hypothetical protein
MFFVMQVRINIGLDFDGNHTFEWTPSSDPNAVDIPHSTLERWAREREAFTIAFLRWRRVMEEIEDTLYHAEIGRQAARPALAVVTAQPSRRR